MKKCTDCKEELPLSSFSINRNKRDGLNYRCKECQKIYFASYYKNNQQAQYTRIKKREGDIKLFIRSLKDKPCTDCDIKYPYYVMEFDHLRDKQFTFSRRKTLGKGRQTILDEASKCEVVCSNCHKERTYQRRHAQEAS